MNAAGIIGVFLVFSPTACGAQDAPGSGDREPAVQASLPATLEGTLEITVTEGDSGEGGGGGGGGGEINFGVLTVGKDEYLVEIEEKTLGAKSEYGEDSYVITSLTPAS